jgi:L-ascorbate metabolism protein UlaG (beta-lactamase superfamily)
MATLTWLGHSCFLVEHDGTRVIIDPFITGNPKATLAVKDLPPLDAILVTHGHGDHLGDAVPLAKQNPKAVLIAPYELAKFCESRGAPTVHAMHIGGAHDFPFGRVKLVVALHGGAVDGDDGTHTTHACGYVLTLGGTRFYHCGDTGLTMDMQLLQGGVDVMLAPIGDNYTMGIEDATRAVGFVKPSIVIPMHYGTFPVIDVDPGAFVTRVGNLARVVVLRPGESFPAS